MFWELVIIQTTPTWLSVPPDDSAVYFLLWPSSKPLVSPVPRKESCSPAPHTPPPENGLPETKSSLSSRLLICHLSATFTLRCYRPWLSSKLCLIPDFFPTPEMWCPFGILPARTSSLLSFTLVTFQRLKENFLIWTHFCFFPPIYMGGRGGGERGLWPCYFLFVFVLENADHLCLSEASPQPSCWFWHLTS